MADARDLARQLRRVLAACDPGMHSRQACALWAEELAATANACLTASTRFAAHAGDRAARQRGFAATQDWLAAAAGASMRDAKTALETIEAVEVCPETSDALREGSISVAQATEIVKTEAEVPGSETEMLQLAKSSNLGLLRERGRRRRQEAIAPEELAAKQHAAREAAHWRDSELGMVRLSLALTPECGIGFVNRLDAETDRVFREAHRRGEYPTRAQCMADAFAGLVAGRGSGKARRADVVFVCDVNAAIRGHAHPGEVCSIVGGGPVPVGVVMEAARDAFIKGVLHDGTKIQDVIHFGRGPNALQRTVLMLGTPPEFDGLTCETPGCGRRYGIEFDHIDPVAHNGPTTLSNIAPTCGPEHKDKTERDRRAGLLSADGTGRKKERRPP